MMVPQYSLAPIRASPQPRAEGWDDSFADRPVRLHTSSGYHPTLKPKKITSTKSSSQPALRKGHRIVLANGEGGVVKWIGHLQSRYVLAGLWVGVHLDDQQVDGDSSEDTYNLDSCDGIFANTRYFTCNYGHGLFVRLSKVRKVLVQNASGFSEYKSVYYHNKTKSTSTTKSNSSSDLSSSFPRRFSTTSSTSDIDKLIMEGNVSNGLKDLHATQPQRMLRSNSKEKSKSSHTIKVRTQAVLPSLGNGQGQKQRSSKRLSLTSIDTTSSSSSRRGSTSMTSPPRYMDYQKRNPAPIEVIQRYQK